MSNDDSINIYVYALPLVSGNSHVVRCDLCIVCCASKRSRGGEERRGRVGGGGEAISYEACGEREEIDLTAGQRPHIALHTPTHTQQYQPSHHNMLMPDDQYIHIPLYNPLCSKLFATFPKFHRISSQIAIAARHSLRLLRLLWSGLSQISIFLAIVRHTNSCNLHLM